MRIMNIQIMNKVAILVNNKDDIKMLIKTNDDIHFNYVAYEKANSQKIFTGSFLVKNAKANWNFKSVMSDLYDSDLLDYLPHVHHMIMGFLASYDYRNSSMNIQNDKRILKKAKILNHMKEERTEIKKLDDEREHKISIHDNNLPF